MKLKKGLIAVLIAANVIMLVVGILTYRPIYGQQTEKDPAPGTEQTAPVTPLQEEQPARDRGKRRYSRARGNRREFIHRGTSRFGGLSLVHWGRGLTGSGRREYHRR